jgi:hypothetical protein
MINPVAAKTVKQQNIEQPMSNIEGESHFDILRFLVGYSIF